MSCAATFLVLRCSTKRNGRLGASNAKTGRLYFRTTQIQQAGRSSQFRASLSRPVEALTGAVQIQEKERSDAIDPGLALLRHAWQRLLKRKMRTPCRCGSAVPLMADACLLGVKFGSLGLKGLAWESVEIPVIM